jgi:hypothetical protein
MENPSHLEHFMVGRGHITKRVRKHVKLRARGSDTHKLRVLFALDRRGLIEHDWSDTAETGRVRVRVEWEDIESPSPSEH